MRIAPPLVAALLAAALGLGHASAQQRVEPRQAPASPTQALFDAINLGDIDEVRAAVAAGADLGARNVLGLTPLDLALDLGQSEIAFFLMSLGRAPSRGAVKQQEQQRPAAALPPPVQRGEAARPVPPASPVVSAPSPAAPLWRGDGGSPVPEAGFLGFDAGRPEGARQPQPQRPRG